MDLLKILLQSICIFQMIFKDYSGNNVTNFDKCFDILLY